ncbi:GntR family transcriptional regulator [Streptomyces sp. SID3343]|uniref:GntR family transcriptional regulator n=1 Tax=Streptomyces sp. SID3343 TaxID=2690260 RepID=UPI001F2A0D44|nr:GntR family transcriptional regulator [Streptomyces sp. SID3343]
MARLRTFRAQAADELRIIIERDYRPGDRLPRETELARIIGLSRNTVREAVALLVAQGLVERRWGVGTTVLAPAPPASFSVTEVVPVKDIIKNAGNTPGLSHWKCVTTIPEPAVAAHFDPAPADAETWYVERVFTTDARPAVYLRDWCTKSLAGHDVDLRPLADVEVDLIGLVKEQTGQTLRRLEGKIQAALADGVFLGADATAPLPLVEIAQTCFTAAGDAVIYSIIQFDTTIVDLTLRRAFTPSGS